MCVENFKLVFFKIFEIQKTRLNNFSIFICLIESLKIDMKLDSFIKIFSTGVQLPPLPQKNICVI